jgi:hypothetical protein
MHHIQKISEQRLALLLEALELLEDLRGKMALFQNQHYQNLKTRADMHTRLTEAQHLRLAEIETVDEG